MNNTSQHTKNNLNPTIGLFGGKVKKGSNGSLVSTTGLYSDGKTNGNIIVAPANVTVTLTLVPASTNNPSGQK